MKSKYEISIWSDVYDEENDRFVEQKEIIIGSDTMTSEARARDPKLVNNINGTNKFTFDLYYRYVDTRTGEEVENPYIPYLVNERKIKVLWKDEWYDLLVKQVKEDQSGRKFSYTCEDSYITELSRTGFELEFATELENNIGTPQELIEKVIDGTDWRFDAEGSNNIYQNTEEPVYEVVIQSTFIAAKCPKGSDEIVEGNPALIYYSCAPDSENLKSHCSFYYSGEYLYTDINEMLAINGNCYEIDVIWKEDDNNNWVAYYNNNPIFTINFSKGISRRYRAERMVDSQNMVYNEILGRYVYEYKDNNDNVLYGFQGTNYDDALTIVNLITNPSNFKNFSGWTGTSLYWKISPTFNKDTVLTDYEAKSYLHFASNDAPLIYFNSGIQNNRTYIPNGFAKDERYIFRIRAIQGDGSLNFEPYDKDYADMEGICIPIIAERVEHNGVPVPGEAYFELDGEIVLNDGWTEYPLKCIKSCSYESLITAVDSCGIFIEIAEHSDYWVEEIQFFREALGEKVVDPDAEEPVTESTRINPNEMATQSVAQLVWKYFYMDENQGATKDTIVYAYVAPEPWNIAIPQMTGYQRYGTIEESQSNRFNILQSIAETFQCWIRFRIDHDERGAIIYDEDNKPRKFIQVKEEAGQETGIGFIYGVDLKDITRTIKSNQISTKTIVQQNENEFGKNGFCSIARSEQNYPRENVIYNFDYYIQHSLLDKDVLYNDLYNENSDLRYYPTLHEKNIQYLTNVENLLNKNTELTRQKAMAKVYEQYITAATNEKESIIDSLIKLAGVEDLPQVQEYADSHKRDTKVLTLLDDLAIVGKTIDNYQDLLSSINESIKVLKKYINDVEKDQTDIINELRELNRRFYSKYSRFIQEGTWQSEDYYNDDLYYLDALQVAYTSSRPQISYDINVLRLSELEEYSSKVFHLGDISFIQDVKYFGYLNDGITPYKEKVVLTEITSCFDTPDKDVIKVQNYKTQFDDLFQRITAATQSLEFSEGKYAKAANIVQSNGTIKASVIQETFNSNSDLVYGAQNQSITMNNTGITVADNENLQQLLKITSGGLFVSNDGGETWKNAVRGDGINTELLTAGRINTEAITVYNGEHPSFRWDAYGLNAYKFDNNKESPTYGIVDTSQYVRFDQFGIYGLREDGEPFIPETEEDVYNKADFGLTWHQFFMRSQDTKDDINRSIEISTVNDILLKEKHLSTGKEVVRVGVGRINIVDDEGYIHSDYGMIVRDPQGKTAFQCDSSGTYLSGWTLTDGMIESKASSLEDPTIRIKSEGSIGAYGHSDYETNENTYQVRVVRSFDAINLNTGNLTTFTNQQINVFVSSIGALSTVIERGFVENPNNIPEPTIPKAPTSIYFEYNKANYQIKNITPLMAWNSTNPNDCHIDKEKDGETDTGNPTYHVTYTYYFTETVQINEETIFTVTRNTPSGGIKQRYVPAAETQWYIDKDGQAVFHNLFADGGKIAGWWIDSKSIYQTYDGEKDRGENDSNVKSELKSSIGNTGSIDYSIITDAINAAIANVGGLLLEGGLINGYNIAQISKRADSAYNNASYALSQANKAYDRADAAYDHVASHRHGLSFVTATVGSDNSYLRPKAYTDYS